MKKIDDSSVPSGSSPRMNPTTEDESVVRGGRENLEFDFRLHSFVRKPKFQQPTDRVEKPRRSLSKVGARSRRNFSISSQSHRESEGLVREDVESADEDLSLCCVSRRRAIEIVANLRGENDETSRLRRSVSYVLDAFFRYSFWFRDTILFESVWVFLALLGTISALIAWIIDELVAALLSIKLNLSVSQPNILTGYLIWTGLSLLATFTAIVCVKTISPVAAGSGIPEMKSVLSGFHIQHYLALRTLVAKILGLSFALCSGLVIGKEGPLVHISSIVSFQLRKFDTFQDIRDSKTLTRQVLGAACAVGVSSTFGAPIGGVLFSIETTSTFYHTQDYWKGFFCAVSAAIVFKQLSNVGYSRDKLISLFTTNFDPLPYSFYEIPVYITLSLGCGIAAGGFVLLHKYLVQYRQLYRSHWLFTKLGAYAITVTLLSTLLQYPFGSYMRLSTQQAIDDLFTERPLSDNSTHIDDWDKPSVFLTLPWFALAKFILADLALTIEVPSGCFSPVFAVGAALGRLFGEVLVLLGGTGVTAGGYALVGAASFTAGVTGAISTAVIVFELTNQLSYMLPVLLSVLVGRAAARVVSLDIYQELASERALPSLPQLSHERNYLVQVQDVMETQTVCIARFACQSDVDLAVSRIPPDRISDPLFEVAIVDSLSNKLYIGSMRGHILAAISLMSEVWQVEEQTERYRSPFSDDRITMRTMDPGVNPVTAKVLDMTTLCDIDDSTLVIPQDTYVPEALLLFHAHNVPSMFVVKHRKVVGRLVLDDLKVMCEKGEL